MPALITYGTEPMPDLLLLRVKAAFPRARLLQTFGTSETGISDFAMVGWFLALSIGVAMTKKVLGTAFAARATGWAPPP